MLVGKLLEIILEHSLSQPHLITLGLSSQLKQKALLKIPRTNSSGLEFLDQSQEPLDLLRTRLDVGPESQVIDNTVHIPAKIAGAVQTADYKCGHIVVVF